MGLAWCWSWYGLRLDLVSVFSGGVFDWPCGGLVLFCASVGLVYLGLGLALVLVSSLSSLVSSWSVIDFGLGLVLFCVGLGFGLGLVFVWPRVGPNLVLVLVSSLSSLVWYWFGLGLVLSSFVLVLVLVLVWPSSGLASVLLSV